MRLWLTRSEPGASRQARELEAAGITVLRVPVISIEPTDPEPPGGGWDWVFFLSEHAVRHAGDLEFCREATVFAVGERTRAVLAEAGLEAETPREATSEGLLELPALAPGDGKRALIVAGEGGRTALAAGLRDRGAEVRWLRCYRRRAVRELVIRPDDVDAIVAASGEGLAAAARVWRAAGGSTDVAVLVPSDRVADEARALGFERVLACAGADTRAILSGVDRLRA